MEAEARRRFGLSPATWVAAFASPKYLSQALSLYVAMYTGFKFVLLLFGATDASDRWAFELTPVFLLNLPDAPLLFLGALLAGFNAARHTSPLPRHRREGMYISAGMAVSLWFALWTAGTATAQANPLRFAMLLVLLAVVPLDRLVLLAGRRAAETVEVGEGATEGPAVGAPEAPPVAGDRELEYLHDLFGESEDRPAEAATDLDHTLQELNGLAAEATSADEEEADSYGSVPGEETEEDLEEEARFSAAELDSFTRWLDTESEQAEDSQTRTEESREKPGKRGRGRWRFRILRR